MEGFYREETHFCPCFSAWAMLLSLTSSVLAAEMQEAAGTEPTECAIPQERRLFVLRMQRFQFQACRLENL